MAKTVGAVCSHKCGKMRVKKTCSVKKKSNKTFLHSAETLESLFMKVKKV